MTGRARSRVGGRGGRFVLFGWLVFHAHPEHPPSTVGLACSLDFGGGGSGFDVGV
jgi:hypothetical protein